ncbi:putative oxidoreductase TDA3 [Phoenix dactylifera]|uniref:Oxidoreductase TDA3 n=1 Tax=Phoenix dactylifera TaxID=42345 RepID=A0A8B7CYZ1_PHODC|nr:putative oxidoreductase TDA3 [Phoenix dactylifera]
MEFQNSNKKKKENKSRKIKMLRVPAAPVWFRARPRAPLPIRSPPTRASTAAMESESAASTGGRGEARAAKRVVVCGGGVIGACTAYFLAKNGAAQVTVVEKSAVACAASGKAGGFLALDWCDGGPLSALARASFHLHRSLSLLLDGPNAYGYRPLDTLSVPLLPAGSSSATAAAGASPLLPTWVDGGTARPPRTLGTVETTAQVHPQLFTRTLLAAAAAEHGVEVVIGEAERVEVEGGRAVAVVLKEGGRAIAADAVVLALGPWSDRFPLVSSLFNVSGRKAHSIVLRPKDPAAITPHALFLSYQPSPGSKLLDPEVYPRPTGEVYICGMSKDCEVPDDPEQIVGEREAIRMLHKVADSLSSHLKDGEAEVAAEQACFLPCTDDGLPVIGAIPGVEGCFVATGHSCWGILNGPATGASLAELILDGRSTTVDLKPFSPSRFLRKRANQR